MYFFHIQHRAISLFCYVRYYNDFIFKNQVVRAQNNKLMPQLAILLRGMILDLFAFDFPQRLKWLNDYSFFKDIFDCSD